MDVSLLWNGWEPVARGAVMTVTGYATLVVLLRITGPRTMSSMTPVDFVIAVTMGSAFGRVLTAEDVAVSQVVAVLVFLVVIQWALAWARAHTPWMGRVLDHPPALLYSEGRMMRGALRRHRLTEADVHNAARTSGHGSLANVHSVLLMMDGALGVITHDSFGDGSSVTPWLERHRSDR